MCVCPSVTSATTGASHLAAALAAQTAAREEQEELNKQERAYTAGLNQHITELKEECQKLHESLHVQGSRLQQTRVSMVQEKSDKEHSQAELNEARHSAQVANDLLTAERALVNDLKAQLQESKRRTESLLKKLNDGSDSDTY